MIADLHRGSVAVRYRVQYLNGEDGSYSMYQSGEIVSISIGSTCNHSLESQSSNLRQQVFL